MIVKFQGMRRRSRPQHDMRYIGYQSPDNEMPSMGDVFGDITDGLDQGINVESQSIMLAGDPQKNRCT